MPRLGASARHEVAIDEAQAAQVLQLALAEAQRAQVLDLVDDLVDERREVHALVAALEAVFDLGAREVMQDDLHHRELVEVGVEQGGDDHGARDPGECANYTAAPILHCGTQAPRA